MTAPIFQFDKAPAVRFAELIARAADGAEFCLGSVTLPATDRVPEEISVPVETAAVYARIPTGELASAPTTKGSLAHVSFRRVAGADRLDASQRVVVRYLANVVQQRHAVARVGILEDVSYDGRRFDWFLAPARGDYIRPALRAVPAAV